MPVARTRVPQHDVATTPNEVEQRCELLRAEEDPQADVHEREGTPPRRPAQRATSSVRYMTSERIAYFTPSVTAQPSCRIACWKSSAIPVLGTTTRRRSSIAVSPP